MEATQRQSKRKLAPLQKESSPSDQFLIPIAQSIRTKRKELGWSLAHAAAMVGVGTRFLQDLELAKTSIQVDQLCLVCQGFGIKLGSHGSPRAKEVRATHFLQTYCLSSAQGPKTASAWIALHLAGLDIAHSMGLSTHKPRKVKGLWTIEAPADQSKLTTLADLYRDGQVDLLDNIFAVEHPGQNHEDQHGPGIASCIMNMRLSAYLPAANMEKIIKWIITSIAINDTQANLTRLRVLDRNSIEMAPLTAIIVGSKYFQATPNKNFKIGKHYLSIESRADQWIQLADIAKVHPKVIFQMMREVGGKIPGLLDTSLKKYYGDTVPPANLTPVLRDIRQNCLRLTDIATMASRNVSGLKIKNQRKIEVIKPIYQLPEKKATLAIDAD